MIVDVEDSRVKLCLKRPEKLKYREDSTGALASLLGKAWGSLSALMGAFTFQKVAASHASRHSF